MTEYVFDNKAAEAATRFGALEALYDAVTFRHLAPYVVEGSQCLEVGGGSGSVALWMSDRVGAHGRVVVTDLNTRFLEAITAPNVEVIRHDIVSDTVEESVFDLAHTRLVLVHLSQREQAIARMLTALKPGGWLVLQEFDSLSMRPDSTAFDEHRLRSQAVLWEVMQSRGVNVRFGRELFPLLNRLGLEEVAAEGHVMFNRGGSAGASLLRANLEQMHDAMLEAGLTEEEFRDDLARLDDSAVAWPSSVLWTAQGRKP